MGPNKLGAIETRHDICEDNFTDDQYATFILTIAAAHGADRQFNFQRDHRM